MITLIAIIIFAGLVVMGATWLSRRNKTEAEKICVTENTECCGAHEVCDRESLLPSTNQPEYFDDEELDELSGVSPEKFTDRQASLISEIFYSLREDNVAAWLRSLQIRNIQLPNDIREQALMIVSERRS